MAGDFSYSVSSVVKCDNCGADMTFDPSINALKCKYCGATHPVDKKISYRRDYLSEVAHGEVAMDTQVYKCPNCAGDIPLESYDTAVKCPYCGATNVIKLEDLKGLKPDSILPFAISQQDASDSGKKWIKKKFLHLLNSSVVLRSTTSRAYISRPMRSPRRPIQVTKEGSARERQEWWAAEKTAIWRRISIGTMSAELQTDTLRTCP